MAENPKYDLLLRGGRVICPASSIDGVRDLAIRDGRIAAVEETILPSSARETIDVSGKLVLPGMIDTHAHVYQYVTGRFGLNADMVGVRSGVTTVIDQGGPSCMTLPGFRHFVVEKAETQVYAFLSAYLVGGLEGHYYPNLYSPSGVDVDATVASASANTDIVRGIKGHAEIGGFARWGIKVLEMSAEIGRRADLPLYVHFGTLWNLPESGANGEDADTIMERVIPVLRPGDILAHPFTRHPGGFVNRHGEVHGVIRAALDRGLKVDVGHGSHFSYRVARKALAMSSMLALGIPLKDVVPMVTLHPAQILGLTDRLGALKPGYAADVSVLFDDHGRFVLRDNENNEVIAERLLRPVFCLRAGKRFNADAPILPQAVAA